ncbi:hypothetical protein SPRG_19723 [Saprolegnia parasitica CBS 223.65]|uniref:DNA helicase n=1 Tax=Saprolegnia parasitica (strain CBS 223.65) TaxID=695850 RepID=A0A067CTI3_SAPPC|nr:hypothetical protein SPRG_19723 [Saprolegnia parasitica CBS 223.65]KDO29841.1 hypothetical protein SPRG_19723 [Saprolegnia parasitica CBS 223.65]|eukprot:XP_012199542.1 hypothetical protein SPRG_19723 [Saprolegnia parasitica CBS 223.65]
MRPTMTLERWLDATRLMLQQERDAEIAQSKLENDTLPASLNPNVLLHLRLASATTGLFGRTVLLLTQGQNRELPAHHFGIGDLVQLSVPTASLTPADANGFPRGIVTKVEEHAISLAFEDLDNSDEYHNQALRLDRLVNDATYRKLHEGIDRLAKYNDGPAMNILNVIFHGVEPQTNPISPLTPSRPMNASQIAAIEYALASKDIALIHGPPGTGKTTTVVELITQCVTKHKMKILVCAPSNIAVDNVLEKVAATKPTFRVTRIGHPARLLPQVLQYCLDARIASADGTAIIADIRKEMGALQTKMAKARKQRAKSSGVYEMRRECQLLRKEIRDQVVREIVEHSDVLFATNAGAATKLLANLVFDVVIIDEAAQALEASCWIPLLMGKRCVLAGDHLQLPPTIKSDVAARAHMTLFDRITRMETTKGVVKMLSTQYRMHAAISDWSSHAMYDGKLASSDAVATRLLGDLAHVTHTTELTAPTLLLLDTAGCGLDEDQDEAPTHEALRVSKSNAGEATIVVAHVRALLSIGLRPDEIAVITPYNAQVQLLKRLLLPSLPRLEIRSQSKKTVGFLADDRRMNVAITRAKRHVALVCDTDTIGKHPFLHALVEHFEAHGEYRSAEEYLSATRDETTANMFDSNALLSELQKDANEAKTPKAKPTTKLAHVKKSALPTQGPPTPPTSVPSPPTSVPSPPTSVPTPSVPVATPPPAPINAPGHVPVTEDDESEDEPPPTSTASAFGALVDDSSSDSEPDHLGDDEAKPAATNSLLRDLHKERVARQKALAVPSAASSAKKKKGKQKKAPASIPVAPIADKAPDEDDMAFLDRVATQATVCGVASCAQRITLMGSVCKFCHLKFCYSHGLPEVHGCGPAVRAFEQARHKTASSAVKSNSYQAKEKRKLLQKALDEKLAAKSTDRKSTKATKAKAKP